MKREEAIRVNLPCTCGHLTPTFIHFSVTHMLYESSGHVRKMGDVMPEEFPEHALEVEGTSDPCVHCEARHNILIRFHNRKIAGIRRKHARVKEDSMPVIEAPVYDTSDLYRGIISPVGVKT